MTLFKNIYRTQSALLKGWDYQNPGGYFITICTKNRNPYFGICENGQMVLNEMGQIANQFWLEIPDHFENVHCGEHVIMPNHTHGILFLNKPVDIVEPLQCNGSTISTNQDKYQFMSKISPKAGSISAIICSYKSVCNKIFRQQIPDIQFEWQTRFHDHIIRNQNELERIENYIKTNPQNWQKDQHYI